MLEERFLKEVPIEVLHELAQAVVIGYRTAASEATRLLANPHRKEVLPFLRAKFIDVLIFEKCSGYFPVKTLTNSAGNWSYTEVRLPTFVLTAARSDEAQGAPRPSKYRKNYALSNEPFSTGELFPEELEEALNTLALSSAGYAVLTHRPSENDPAIPEYIRIVFPTADSTAVIGAGINLFDYLSFTPEINGTSENLHEIIEDDIDLPLKDNSIEEGEDEEED